MMNYADSPLILNVNALFLRFAKSMLKNGYFFILYNFNWLYILHLSERTSDCEIFFTIIVTASSQMQKKTGPRNHRTHQVNACFLIDFSEDIWY